LNKRAEAVVALRAAIEQAQEPVAWLTKELMADYLDMTAEAIENNGSEMLRNKAYWMRVKGDIVSIAAMKQALEFIDSVKVHPTQIATRDALHTALRAAIEQAEKQEPVGEVLNERGEVDYISYVPPVGTPFYTAPQSINDFKPDWDTVKAYDEKFAEMLDEQQRLRAELKRTEQRLHDVATLCANVEGVLKAVNTAAMKLTADLTCMEIDNDDRLDRDHVMERVMRWRNEWDKAMFEYKPKVTQRKPLTDERIALIAAASGGLASDFVITVARAIEAAHGIGERK
jgi:hypothetical protein